MEPELVGWLKSNFTQFVAKTEEEKNLVNHLCAKGEEKIIEEDVVNFFSLLLFRQDQWVETKVNLWEVVPVHYDLSQTMWESSHPLQPDIDILSGPLRRGKRGTPLLGIEAKLFHSKKKGKGVIPKTSDGRGFYAGMEEALALFDLGLDYVTLVQFFTPHTFVWLAQKDLLSPLEDLIIQYDEWRGIYTGLVRAIIKKYHLPIGYLHCDLVIAENAIFYRLPAKKEDHIEGRLVPLSVTAGNLRQALLKKFNVEESLYKFEFMEEKDKSPRPRWDHVIYADKETPKSITVEFRSDRLTEALNIRVECFESLTKEEMKRLVSEATEVATLSVAMGWRVPAKLIFSREHGILIPPQEFGLKEECP